MNDPHNLENVPRNKFIPHGGGEEMTKEAYLAQIMERIGKAKMLIEKYPFILDDDRYELIQLLSGIGRDSVILCTKKEDTE